MNDPFCPALAAASEDPPEGKPLPLLDPYHRIKHVAEEELPRCPQCKAGLQRPGVVWFGEELDANMINRTNDWITADKIVCFVNGLDQRPRPAGVLVCCSTLLYATSMWLTCLQDLMLVVGTSAQVYPAAGYISRARLHGARIVTVNPEAEDEAELHKMQPGDFAFGEDAAECLPKLLEPAIGKLPRSGEEVHK